jgi:hypothetical protein
VTTRKRDDVFWPIIGIDTPYPENVQNALDLIAKENQRLRIEEQAKRQRERQALCPHDRTERYMQRYANGDMCIDFVVCSDCNLSGVPER